MNDDQKFTPPTGPVFNLANRFVWSWQGARHAWASEPSFRSWIYANLVSASLAITLAIEPWQRVLILVLGLLVLVVELLNTAIEGLADHVEPRQNLAIKNCKDASSAAVALTAVSAGVVWVFAIVGLAT